MERLKTGGLQFLLLAALSVFGIGCVASQADARSMITSEQELLEVVEEADAGWDWVPTAEIMRYGIRMRIVAKEATAMTAKTGNASRIVMTSTARKNCSRK